MCEYVNSVEPAAAAAAEVPRCVSEPHAPADGNDPSSERLQSLLDMTQFLTQKVRETAIAAAATTKERRGSSEHARALSASISDPHVDIDSQQACQNGLDSGDQQLTNGVGRSSSPVAYLSVVDGRQPAFYLVVLQQLRELSVQILKVYGQPESDARMMTLLVKSLESKLKRYVQKVCTTSPDHPLELLLQGHSAQRRAALSLELESIKKRRHFFVNSSEISRNQTVSIDACQAATPTASENKIDASRIHSAQIRQTALCHVVHFLRKRESAIAFQYSLSRAQHKLASTGPYSEENFTYGTTPFSSWLQLLHQSASVRAAAAMCVVRGDGHEGSDRSDNDQQERLADQARTCTVFGSSTGMLAFYAVLCQRLRTSCWEIMPCLVDVAKECLAAVVSKMCIPADVGEEADMASLAQTPLTMMQPHLLSDESTASACLGALFEHLQFFQGDMLTASLHETQLLFLTSQCWDHGLLQQVYTKVIEESTPGCVVVDYMDRRKGPLARLWNGRPSTQHGGCQRLEFRDEISIPVSWNSDQKMFVHVVV